MSKKDETIKALKKKNKKLKAELAKLKSKSKSGSKAKIPAKDKPADKKKVPAKPERMKFVAKELKSEPAPVRVVAGGSA